MLAGMLADILVDILAGMPAESTSAAGHTLAADDPETVYHDGAAAYTSRRNERTHSSSLLRSWLEVHVMATLNYSPAASEERSPLLAGIAAQFLLTAGVQFRVVPVSIVCLVGVPPAVQDPGYRPVVGLVDGGCNPIRPS